MKNRINVVLTGEQAATIAVAVEAVKDAMPFLISLSPGDRKYMLKAANGTEGFIQGALHLARQNPELVPALVDLTDLERDLKLRDTLAPIEATLTMLATKVNHTRRLANADLYEGCLDIYHELRRHGQDRGLDALLVPLRTRFKPRPSAPEGQDPAPVA